MTDFKQRALSRADRNRRAKLQALGRELELRRRELELRARLAATELQAAARERDLAAQLAVSRSQIQAIVNSRSWKLTQPLRDLSSFARKESRLTSSPQSPARSTAGVNSSSASKVAPSHTRDVVAPGAGEVIPHADDRKDFATGDSSRHLADVAADNSVRTLADDFVSAGRDAWEKVGRNRLQALLGEEQRLIFPAATQPIVSIIVALYNRAHLALLCIESILRHTDVGYELILIDNGSADDAGRLLDRLSGVEIIRNKTNRGFGYACMQGAERARGEYLCFLNSDALLAPGSLATVLDDFREDESVGAIGGKILFADGRLQEAGSIVWNDGSAWGYGRGDDPRLPKYEFRRPVDYCSGAFLLTQRTLFQELGGFDARFFPAYYEDTDYCMKVWASGRKVIYEPRAAIHHYESASFENAEAAKAPIAEKQQIFAEKWRPQLNQHLPRGGEFVAYARIAAAAPGLRILFIDDRIPHRGQRSESAHSHHSITQLLAQGHFVTCISNSWPLGDDEYSDVPRDVEVANSIAAAHYLFRELLPRYDAVWIRGGQNLKDLLCRLRDVDDRFPPIIYDAVTIPGEPGHANAATSDDLDEERALWLAADVILVRDEDDRQAMEQSGAANVHIFTDDTVAQVLAEIAPREGVTLNSCVS